MGELKIISQYSNSTNQKFISDNQLWKNQIKKMLKKAQKNKNNNPSQVVSALRHGSRYAYLAGKRILAVEIMKTCFNFLDKESDQFFLSLSDLHLYKTGEKKYFKRSNSTNLAPIGSKNLKELSQLIIEI